MPEGETGKNMIRTKAEPILRKENLIWSDFNAQAALLSPAGVLISRASYSREALRGTVQESPSCLAVKTLLNPEQQKGISFFLDNKQSF